MLTEMIRKIILALSSNNDDKTMIKYQNIESCDIEKFGRIDEMDPIKKHYMKGAK
ncbi:MAG: hypothetical protein K2N99_02945 [Malacoplasma sp.]|nr:hypothetical protein [Malacoplasma sp.]